MKRFSPVLIMLTLIKKASFLVWVMVVGATAAFAHFPEGVTYYAVRFPDSYVPTIDGDLSDWDIIPDDYLITTEMMYEQLAGMGLAGTGVDLSDMAIVLMVGWNDRANRLYVGAQTYDDVHLVMSPADNPQSLWKNDDLEIMADMDHSGGQYAGFADLTPEESKRLVAAQAQQWGYAFPREDGIYAALFWSAATWTTDPPYQNYAFNFEGTDLGPGTTTYEVELMPWVDVHWMGPDESTLGDLEELDIIGLQFAFADFDEVENPTKYHAYWTVSGQDATYMYAERFADLLLAPMDDAIDWATGTSRRRVATTVTIGLRRVTGGSRIVNRGIAIRAGDRAEFSASATNVLGRTIEVPIQWSVLGQAGTLSSTGAFAASTRAGDKGSIVATAEDGSDTVTVTIIPNRLKRIEITPASVELRPGEQVTFEAQGYDAYDNPIGIRPLWHVTREIGRISSITGTFVAGERAGSGDVVAFAQAVFGDTSADVLSGSAKVVVRAVPGTYALYPNIPNPFNPSTTIRYALPQASMVWFAVYNLSGQQVRVLDQGMREARVHRKTWDGRDEDGREVSSGVYVVQLVASTHPRRPAFSATRRMVLVR